MNTSLISSHMRRHANFITELQLMFNLKEGTANEGLLPECSGASHSKLVECHEVCRICNSQLVVHVWQLRDGKLAVQMWQLRDG